MGTPTYQPIAEITLGSSAASVSFSSINQGYRDLVLVAQYTNASSSNPFIWFNGDRGSNYSYVNMRGNGSVTNSTSNTSTEIIFGYGTFSAGAGTDSFNAAILDYTATDKHKTVLVRQDNASLLTSANAGRWASTSAITSLSIGISSGSFAIGSTFSLYGVLA